jgi:exonuclease SbcD
MVAMMPFLSQKRVISADDLMQLDQAEHQGKYAGRCKGILDQLCQPFRQDAVNLVLAHLTVTNAAVGGGERAAETVFDYWLPPQSLPSKAHYIALGHLHKAQSLPVQWPAWYSGSPMQLDFGEESANTPAELTKHVLVFEASPGRPVGDVRPIPLAAPRRLMTLRGTLTHLRSLEPPPPNAYLRVLVEEPARPGLADDVREIIPNALDVRVVGGTAPAAHAESHRGRAPGELFAEYLQSVNGRDELVENLFTELLEEAHASEAA